MNLPNGCVENWRVAVVTTAHIPESFAPSARDKACLMDDIALMSSDYNYLVQLDERTDDLIRYFVSKRRESAHTETLVQAFIDFLYVFRQRGFTHVLFDADGPEIPGFTTFDW